MRRRRRRLAPTSRTASSWCSSARRAAASRRCCALIAGLEEATAGSDLHRRPRRHRPAAARARPRDGLPELRALPAHDGAPEPRLRAQGAPDAEGRDAQSASSGSRGLLRLEELLDRRPAALSGGQRQRVAMGRAIVREPKAFLMDEPLSNLDAKLRVSMRAELASLHARLGATTVYVTHDQVEAMTLGQRVAVHARRPDPAGRHAADALPRPGRTSSSRRSSARPR